MLEYINGVMSASSAFGFPGIVGGFGALSTDNSRCGRSSKISLGLELKCKLRSKLSMAKNIRGRCTGPLDDRGKSNIVPRQPTF